jgi:hypothetical protein
MAERSHLRAASGDASAKAVDNDVHGMYKIYHVLAMLQGCLMEANKVLTDFFSGPTPRPELANLLAQAGLELWQAPEGYWAIRLKQAAMPAMTKPTRRLRRAR